MGILDVAALQALDRARTIKEWSVNTEYTDIHPLIDVFRGYQPMASIAMMRAEPRELMHVASLAAQGFDADILALSLEAWHTPGTAFHPANVNPLTGKPYVDAAELQDVVDNHEGVEKGWVFPNLAIYVVNRAGDVVTATQRYRLIGSDLTWDGPPSVATGADADEHIGAGMLHLIRRVMLGPSASAMVDVPDKDLPRVERDYLTAQFIMRDVQCSVQLISEPDDTERIEALNHMGMRVEPPSQN